MISEYQYFYMDSRENQIKKLEDRKSMLKPYIREAYEIVVPGNKIEKKDNVELLIKVIFVLAEEFKKNEELQHGEPTYTLLNLPEGLIVSNELVKRILPQIEKLRQELFSKKTSPFPKSDNKALSWLKEQSKGDIQLVIQATRKNKIKIKNLLQEISNNIDEINNLSYEKFKLTTTSKFLPYPRKDGWKEVILVKDNRPLERLEKETRQLSEITNFSQAQLVKFVLTGVKPQTPIYNLKVEYPAKSVNLKIYRPIDKRLLELLNRQIKEIFERKGKHFLEEKHRDLYFLVESHGGPPKRNKMAFWTTIMKEWNDSAKSKKIIYTYPNSVNMAYRRILEFIQSGISPIKPFDEQFSLDKPKGKFETKEEWEKHKEELKKMTRFHAKVLRQIKEGKRKTEKVVDFNIK